jgi:hypothetical protein
MQRKTNGGLNKQRAKLNDALPGWVANFVEGAEEFSHLSLVKTEWKPPGKWTIKYSKQTKEHMEAMEHVRQKRQSSRGRRRS